MTELDLEIPGLASELIAEFGKSIAYTVTTSTDYNPATSSYAPAGAPFNIKGVVEPYKGQRMLAGLVEAEDLKVTVAAESFPDGEPTTGDIMTFDNETFGVVNVMPTYSGERIAIYEFQIRRG